ncbi:alpha/beta fold hydrolase [Bradyrhizobium sp.]|uniref:alpha/beta fold hydrolase n=1 Tax=Bradyrhizobium sp. TaxID=376 RepID=UPI003C4C0472
MAISGFSELRVPGDHGSIYVRDFPGRGPAFVVLHGFPDNSLIYDELIPHLVSAGRRTVAVDFLGFGASDKPKAARYSFAQQLGDLEAVVETLKLDQIIPVGHDAGGPAAVNFALKHPDRAAAIILMNAFYGDAPGLRVPELIALFSRKELKALQDHFLSSPQQFAWLLDFQRERLKTILKDTQKTRYMEVLGPIIDDNFRQGAGPAFAQMTFQLTDEIAAGTARLIDFRNSDVPLLIIWGRADPYLHVSVAEYLRSQAKNAALHVLEAGHWPQIDEAAEVARIILGSH